MKLDDALLRSMILDALERGERRKEAGCAANQTLTREAAVAQVETIFRAQMNDPLPENGHAIKTVIGLLAYGDYFPTTPPSEADFAKAIELAETDYYAFQAVDFLQTISLSHLTPAQQDWAKRRNMGQVVQPHKPPGASRYKFAHRDMLIVSQIRALQVAGFKARRGDATDHTDSACDIVIEALGRTGLAMSYSAVEAIWKSEGRKLSLSEIAKLMSEGFQKLT